MLPTIKFTDERKITNNNKHTREQRLPLEEGHRDSKALENAAAFKQANQKLYREANNYP